MRNTIIGVVTGVVAGAIVGATILAPHIVPPTPSNATKGQATETEEPVDNTKAEDAGREPATQWIVRSSFPTHLPHLGAMVERFERDLWRVSDGAFEIRIQEPAPEEDVEAALNAVVGGTVDAFFTTPALWANRSVALQLFGAVPFGMDARAYLSWMTFGKGRPLLDETMTQEGLHAVPCGMATAQGAGWFLEPLRTIEDLQGLKIRFTGLGARVLDHLGVTVVPLPGRDILTSLEAGAIGGAAFSTPAADLALGFHKVAGHLYFPGWQAPATVFYLVVNAERWATLPAVRQTQVSIVCGNDTLASLAESDAVQFAALKKIVRDGGEVHRLPKEIQNALEDSWRAVAEEESSTNKDFRKVLASMRAFEPDYRIWRDLSAP